VRETAGAELRVDDEEVAASLQDKVNINVNGQNLVVIRILTDSGNQLRHYQRLDSAYDPEECPMSHRRSAARRGADESVELIIGLFQVA
jgi:hypothetical protein